jgi:hypothetical protein
MIRTGNTPDLAVPGQRDGRRAAAGSAALIFVGEMYGVQLDQLAQVLGGTQRSAIGTVSKWIEAGLAESAKLGPGPRWIWLTRSGLTRCGLPYTASVPALSRLAHLRAVTAVRIALAGTPQFGPGQAYWRSERRIRAKFGRRMGLREHLPDGELHWPDDDALAWAGECWAIEAELTPKTVARTATIMREILTRTGDYGCPPDQVIQAARPARHARVIYVCSPAARLVVARSRDSLGDLARRVEIRLLPPDAQWQPD